MTVPWPTSSSSIPGGQLPLPVAPATEGPAVSRSSTLLKETGYVTLDPGFVNTASCASAITYIDGDAGILRYRGYPIDQLAEKSSFLEVSYLLIYGELPTADAARRRSRDEIRDHTLLHEDLQAVLRRLPARRAPDGRAVVGGQRAVDLLPGQPRPVRPRHVEMSTVRLMAKLPTIASYAYKKSVGQPLLYPDNSLGYVENFLRMTFGVPATPYEVDPVDGPGARHAVRAARRPRAELLDLDRAAGRLEQRQPVRVGLGRRQRAVRPAARRRQPGRAGDAAAHPRRRRRRRRASSSGSRTRSPASS